jgi:hypothetical protein
MLGQNFEGNGARSAYQLNVTVLQYLLPSGSAAGVIPVANDPDVILTRQADGSFLVSVNKITKRVLAISHVAAVNSTTVSPAIMSQVTAPVVTNNILAFRIWAQNVTNTAIVVPSVGFLVEIVISNAPFGY